MGEAPQETGFWEELKRRKVVRVAVVYVAVSWLILQVADVVFENFGIPPWGFRFVTILLVLGFPVSLVLAWALELTPEGIRRTPSAEASAELEQTTPGHDARRKRFSLAFAAAVPTVIFGTLALVFWLQRGQDAGEAPDQAAAPAGAATEHTIAVLPLVNLSTLADNAFFVGGLHDEILSHLSRVEGFQVVSRTSVTPYFDTDKSMSTIGAELGADFIVEGSVRRIENHVRVIAQLIEAKTDRHLWANNFDRELRDEFATQSAVAREITRSIQLEVLPDTLDAVDGLPTSNVKAYDFFNRAMNLSRTEVESESMLRRERALLEQAVAEDPAFVEAWGALNDTIDHSIRTVIQSGWFVPEGGDPEPILEAFSAASKRALDKAVSLDPDNFWTLVALHHDPTQENESGWAEQVRGYIDRMLREYPEEPTGWLALGWHHYYNNNMEDARPAFLKAIELDPFHAGIVYSSLVYFRIAGDQEMVTLLFERLAKIAPEKGEQTRLAEASDHIRLFNLLQAFWQTSDERLIDRYEEILFDPETKFLSPLFETASRMTYWELRNDPEKLVDVQDRLELPASADFFEIEVFNRLSIMLASFNSDRGARESAEYLARKVLATQALPPVQNVNTAAANHAWFGSACFILGDEACARRWTELSVEERSNATFTNSLAPLMALSLLDPDRGVRMILEERARRPGWPGTDVLATSHLTTRHLLRHPDMIAFYRQEGKWMEYLAARVPEYAAQ